MSQNDRSKNRQNGALVSVGAGVGSGFGAALAAITGDWFWMPTALSACISLAIVAGFVRSLLARSL